MASHEALVTPKLLRWARETAHLRIDEAAKKIGVSEDRVKAWESGEERPSWAKARVAADVYGRPLAIFYLEDVPRDFAIVRDFRHLPGTGRPYSYALTLMLREIQARQEWAREIFQELREPALRFVGSITTEADVATVATNIRSTLGITARQQESWRSMNEALNAWIESVERARIFVSQTSVRGEIEVEDARGVALADRYAPFIYLNPKDSLGGRIFTLAHELAHIWLGASGVSGADLSAKPGSDEESIEVFCNRVAANIVLPHGDFSRAIRALDTTSIASRIPEIAKQFRVSRDVVARRLADSGFITWRAYSELHKTYIREWQEERSRPQAGGNYYVNHVRALSRRFVRVVGDVYVRGRITGAEASGLLNVKIDKLSRLMERAHTGDAA